jgi:16S rRNA (cytosine967-C5)-methyltransferase
LDLRVNPVKTGREEAIKILAGEGIEAEPTPLSPLGLRVKGRPALASTKAFQSGLVEIQDEGSQMLALLLDAHPGHQVVDFCAGAGGKTLAIAAMMQNKGRVIACDVLERRLERAAERFRRAGLFNIETRALSTERDPWVKRHKGKFDRVLVDAPCSGVGVWRRNPDARWRVLGPGLEELVPLQGSILESAARLVKPGGRLVYATCSLLTEENEGRVEKFLALHPEFTLVPYGQDGGRYLQLTPAVHNTDGFFGAVMVRDKEETPQSAAS